MVDWHGNLSLGRGRKQERALAQAAGGLSRKSTATVRSTQAEFSGKQGAYLKQSHKVFAIGNTFSKSKTLLLNTEIKMDQRHHKNEFVWGSRTTPPSSQKKQRQAGFHDFLQAVQVRSDQVESQSTATVYAFLHHKLLFYINWVSMTLIVI